MRRETLFSGTQELLLFLRLYVQKYLHKIKAAHDASLIAFAVKAIVTVYSQTPHLNL